MELKQKPVDSLIEIVALECREAGASEWDTAKIVKILSKKRFSTLKSIRKKAILELKKINSKAADVYNSFYRLKVLTSDMQVQAFDRGNIIKSLLKETSISRGLAKTIGREVENKIKDLDISFISTSMIRELVNERLVSYGYENIRRQYARIGLPVYEAKKLLRRSKLNASPMLKEYVLFRVLSHKALLPVFEKKIVIPKIEDFASKIFSFSTVCPKNFFELQKLLLSSLKISSYPPILERANFLFEQEKKTNSRNKILTKSVKALQPVLTELPALNLSLYSTEKESIHQKKQALFFAEKIFEKKFFPVVFEIDSRYETGIAIKWNGKKFFLNSSQNKNYFLFPGIACPSPVLLHAFYVDCSKVFKKDEKAFFSELEKILQAINVLAQAKQRELTKSVLPEKNFFLEKGFFYVCFKGVEKCFFGSNQKPKSVNSFFEELTSFSLRVLEKNFLLGFQTKPFFKKIDAPFFSEKLIKRVSSPFPAKKDSLNFLLKKNAGIIETF